MVHLTNELTFDWCSPVNMNKLRQHYLDILCEMADADIMQDICSQLLGKKIKYHKDTNDLSKYLADGEHFLS